MEDFDDDDFSDLYADVEVQASSAITALNQLTKMSPGGEDEGGGLTKLPLENGGKNELISDDSYDNRNSIFEVGGRIDVKEKSVEEGVCNFHKKNLKHVSLNSKKKRDDENASSQHEVSECDSDKTDETSDDTNRRDASGRYGSSSSPRASISDDDIDKHSKNPSLISSDQYHHSRDFRGRHIKPSKELDRKMKSNDMRYLKSHREQRDMCNVDSVEDGLPYFNQSNFFFNSFGGFFPDYHSGPTYLRNQCWNTNPYPGFGCKADSRDGHNMSERRNILLKRSRKMHYEAVEDDGYHNRRKRVEGKEESKRVTRKYSGALHFRKRTKGDYLSSLHDEDNKVIEGRYRRLTPSGDNHRDQLDHRHDRYIAHDRMREVETSERGKRGIDSFPSSSSNLRFAKNVDNEMRYKKHRPLPVYSYEEPRARGPESGISERNVRCSWREMGIENGKYGTDIKDRHVQITHCQKSTNSYVTNGHTKDHFVRRRRHHRHLEVLHSRDGVYKSRHRDDNAFYSEGPSCHFERISTNNATDDRTAFGRVAELVVEREVYEHKYKMMRGNHSNRFEGAHRFIQPRSCVQMHPRYQDSVDYRMGIEGNKCTMPRTSEAGVIHIDRHDPTWNDNHKRKFFEDLDDFKPQTAVLTDERKIDDTTKLQDLFNVNQKNELLDIEEGQIIPEEIDEDSVKCGVASGYVTSTSTGNGFIEKLGDDKILEIIAKMEKRRERFKEPLTSSKDYEKTSNQLFDLDVETNECKSERPVRKRGWCDN